ncbi:13781_t:CDS:2, partial [Racocetra fulgida]
TCCVWQEDYQRNFITFIPPNVTLRAYYCFTCATFDGMELWGADLKNGGYNRDTCFHVYGGEFSKPKLDEAPYEECQKIRDSK